MNRKNRGTKSPLLILFLFLMAFLIGSDSPWLSEFITVPTGSRHIAIGASFMILMMKSHQRLLPKNYLFIFLLTIFWALLSTPNALNGYFPYVLGWLFTYLFAVIFLMSYSYDASHNEIIRVLKFFVWIVFIMSLPSFLQGLIQGENLRWLPGGFRELGAFGLSMVLALIASLALYFIGAGRKYAVIAAFLVLCITMTVLKKSIAEYLFVLFMANLLLFNTVKSRTALLVAGVTILPILIAFLGDDLAANVAENQAYIARVGADGHVRLVMYLSSAQIALANFPFGSGYGSFGSLASISFNYSPLYLEYGVYLTGANAPSDVENGFHTLLDTFWPHIIAEAGVVGSILFLILFLYPIKMAMQFSHASRLHKGFSFFVVMSILVLALDGLALYTPETPLFIFLVPGLAGFICRWLVTHSKGA